MNDQIKIQVECWTGVAQQTQHTYVRCGQYNFIILSAISIIFLHSFIFKLYWYVRLSHLYDLNCTRNTRTLLTLCVPVLISCVARSSKMLFPLGPHFGLLDSLLFRPFPLFLFLFRSDDTPIRPPLSRLGINNESPHSQVQRLGNFHPPII